MDSNTESLHNKIRGLLRKAESTPFEQEAATFYRKAQELMARYAVDEAVLWASDPSRKQEITTIDIEIPDKLAGAHYRRTILATVAQVNRCRSWYYQGESRSTVAGFPTDLVFVEMLYSSIITHMNFALAKALAIHEGSSHGRTFRKDFTAGYADRIRERLMLQRDQAEAYLRDNAPDNGISTDLVLRDRATEVADWVNSRYNFSRSTYAGEVKDRTAAGAGHMAANTADITGGKSKPVGKPKGRLTQ